MCSTPNASDGWVGVSTPSGTLALITQKLFFFFIISLPIYKSFQQQVLKTQDLKRKQITARMTTLVYNWWSLFVRLIEPTIGLEAITSRPLLLTGVARASEHAVSTTLFLNSSHAQTQKIRKKLADLTQFLRELQSAPQLTSIERWCRILGRTLVKFFGGRNPMPPSNMPILTDKKSTIVTRKSRPKWAGTNLQLLNLGSRVRRIESQFRSGWRRFTSSRTVTGRNLGSSSII